MIIVVSPAKTLDYESALPIADFTEPEFLGDSSLLIDELRKKSNDEISSMMKLSDKLTELNVLRYDSWSLPFNSENARPGMFAFKGDVYLGLDAYSFSKEEILYAQDHLRILSGLYGVLRPLDLMQPYRLEMGTRLSNVRGKNLYEFWASKISESLNSAHLSEENNVIVNLASNEYFSAIDKKALLGEVVTPVFYDWKNDKYKIISFYAKKARGYMASWILRNKIVDPKDIIKFNVEGYYYSSERSTELSPVFLREGQE